MEAHLAKNTFSEKNTNRERLLRQLCLGLRLAEAKKTGIKCDSKQKWCARTHTAL